MLRRVFGRRWVSILAVVAVLLPVAALADQSWTDAPDGNFYSDALEWATVNGMTQGCDGGTNFCPDRGATRAESITFAQRYDDLVVQPALDDIRAEIAANPGPQGPAGAAGADGVDAESPDRVVWVADDSSGDFLLLSAALASISDASASNPYVVRIAPGVYTETATVALKTYVDVEGSGQGVTTITCECASASWGASSATVSAGDIAAEIRHLTIENTGGGDYSFGVYTNGSSPSVSMMNVTATATGGTSNYGVHNSVSSPSMTNVTATATGGGDNYAVFSYDSSSTMNNVTATATGGEDNYAVFNTSSSPSIRASSLTSDDISIYNETSVALVADTMLDGWVSGDGFTCVGVYDEGFSALDQECTST
jgi:hypothetical protein